MPDPPDWVHPAAVGRAAELEALAATVRRLVRLTVVNDAAPEVLADADAALRAVADVLAAHVPEVVPSITQPGPERVRPDAGAMTQSMMFDCVVGPGNPMAPPVTLRFDPPKASGMVRFDSPQEGPPGCVHGGVIASVFDIVLSAANIVSSVAGPTVSLSLRYRKPTLLHTDCVFEGWVEQVDDRRVRTVGRLLQGEAVTVEAEGVFARIDRARTLSLGSS